MVRFIAILSAVAATMVIVGLLERWIGFAPLILCGVPIVVFLRVWGIGAALITATSAAVMGDFFFVEPSMRVTVHAEGLRLLLIFVLATAGASLATRGMPHRR